MGVRALPSCEGRPVMQWRQSYRARAGGDLKAGTGRPARQCQLVPRTTRHISQFLSVVLPLWFGLYAPPHWKARVIAMPARVDDWQVMRPDPLLRCVVTTVAR